MFDLEQSIADWRKQMLAAGIKTPVPLEELEIHLREEIERQMKLGLNEQKAFEFATGKIGHARELKNEFRKASETLYARFVRLAGIGCGMVAFLFSLWILFVLLFILETGWTAKLFGLMGTATILLNWKFNYKFLPVIRNPMIRTAIGFACCIACLFWMQLFIVQFVPAMLEHTNSWGLTRSWSLSNGLFAAVFVWGWTTMAILGGVGIGLEKAARKATAI